MKKFIILIAIIALTIPARAQDSSRPRFLGLGATVSAPISFYKNSDYRVEGYSAAVAIGVDYAKPVSDRFAIGMYASLGGGPVFSRRVYSSDGYVDRNGILPGFELKAGILMLVGDVSDKPFILGVAPCTGFGMCNPTIYLPAEIRFGRLLTNKFYVTGNLGFGIPLGYNDGTETYFFIHPGITLGCNFGPKRNR